MLALRLRELFTCWDRSCLHSLSTRCEVHRSAVQVSQRVTPRVSIARAATALVLRYSPTQYLSRRVRRDTSDSHFLHIDARELAQQPGASLHNSAGRCSIDARHSRPICESCTRKDIPFSSQTQHIPLTHRLANFTMRLRRVCSEFIVTK